MPNSKESPLIGPAEYSTKLRLVCMKLGAESAVAKLAGYKAGQDSFTLNRTLLEYLLAVEIVIVGLCRRVSNLAVLTILISLMTSGSMRNQVGPPNMRGGHGSPNSERFNCAHLNSSDPGIAFKLYVLLLRNFFRSTSRTHRWL